MILFTTLFAILYSAYILGAFILFDRDGPIPLGMVIIGAATVPLVIYLTYSVYFASASSSQLVLGAVLWLIAALLFVCASLRIRSERFTLAFSQDQPRRLVLDGPFAWVRHPFYASYLSGYLGATIIIGTYVAYSLFAIMFLLYWRAAISDEKKILSSDLGPDYLVYADKVGRFIPKLEM